MNWEAIGAVGEVVGALAVVVTLLYLASQSKNNTSAINRAAVQATLRGRGESTRFLASDPEISALMWRGAEQPQSLDEIEWQRFLLMCASIIRPMELAFLDYEAGRMHDGLWLGQKSTLEFWFAKPGIQRWLTDYGQTLYPNFQTYLQEIVAAYAQAATATENLKSPFELHQAGEHKQHRKTG